MFNLAAILFIFNKPPPPPAQLTQPEWPPSYPQLSYSLSSLCVIKQRVSHAVLPERQGGASYNKLQSLVSVGFIQYLLCESELWISIGFNFQCGSGSRFLSQCGCNPDPGSQTSFYPCGSGYGSWSDLRVTKSLILKQVIGKKKHTFEGTRALQKARKPSLFVNFGEFPCSWIRIRIPNMDPDPGQPKNADPNPHHGYECLALCNEMCVTWESTDVGQF